MLLMITNQEEWVEIIKLYGSNKIKLSQLIEDIMIDTSIESLGKFYSVRELLYENLGDDIVDFVILDYVKNNVLHI